MTNSKKIFVNITYALLLLVSFALTSTSYAFNLTVTNESGIPVDGFKWTLEEDQKFKVTPGVQTQDSLALSFHNSYSPIVSSGECQGTAPGSCVVDVADTTKTYFISVLPFTGHSLGGAKVEAGQAAVNVDSHTTPLPTSQITIRLFHDFYPINGVPDDPKEKGLPVSTGNFTVKLFEAGGRFGATGGEVTQDAFGNPLGTVYDPLNPDVVVSVGAGSLIPDAEGYVYIKNLPPAKYGIIAIPPAGEGWIQTSTIEGTKTVDAWVKANEPSFFAEFGPPGPHVFIGFTKPLNTLGGGTASISGRIVNNHMARPPAVGFYPGEPIADCWVGLNETAALGGPAVYAAPCNDDSTFSITNIPDGTYDLVVWDKNLDLVIARRTLTTTDAVTGAPLNIALGDVPVFNWFARVKARVFHDANENGFRDAGEQMMPEQGVNIRFRNGTPYQSFPTDLGGEAPFDEVFPFFHWLVAEVDFTRYKATGVTYVVDDGGAIQPDAGWAMPSFDELTPQSQGVLNINTGNDLSTTVTGPVLTMAFQAFLGQTNVMEWGKTLYGAMDTDNAPYGNFPGSEDIDNNGDGVFEYGNGGVSGMVLYAITRAEDDPRYAAAEEWEPGIPRVQVTLYQDVNGDQVIDNLDTDVDADGVVNSADLIGPITLSDVDNAPQGNFPGAEDTDRNGNGVFDYGDALQVTYTDSWDDSLPTGCKGPEYIAHPGTPIAKTLDCHDGLRNFNQIREGVFDGGYAFSSHLARNAAGVVTGDEIPGLVPGFYIVESATPSGYELLKEEDKNVDFGDAYVPAQLPPVCVGDSRVVPANLSMQTSMIDGTVLPGIAAADVIAAPFAGTSRPLCDRKLVALTAAKNAAVDFFLFTDAPIAAHVVGGILNDLAAEFDPNNPNFGEKFAPSWVPVTFQDWTGKVIVKTYADEFGKYNVLVPSTSTVNIGSPTGLAPNMMISCMNDPSPIPNPNYDPLDPASSAMINDPNYNPQFSTFCYTFQYMPGSTTYLDTPIVPISAFASTGRFPVDCEIEDNQPVIKSVTGPLAGPAIPTGLTTLAARELTIVSEGVVAVPNHLFGITGQSQTINRNYGFGATEGLVTISGTPLMVLSWTNTSIVVNVPVGTPTGQLDVTTASGVKSLRGITVTTHLPAANIVQVYPSGLPNATPIQDAIDAAAEGDLILVTPGNYGELVIMDKAVQLQGAGAGATRLSAIQTPAEKLELWRTDIKVRGEAGNYDLLSGQPANFESEEGGGITVLGKVAGNFNANTMPRIDGFEISGALSGGGIYVNAFVDYLNISNNKIINNSGTYAGGIRVGNPTLTTKVGNSLVHADSSNDFINIHNNQISQNGASFGSGGGIGIYKGTNDYTIESNYICGNFSLQNGAGIAHLGLSNNGQIINNVIALNQNFNQGINVHGAGIFIGGQPGLENRETEGAGNVLIEANQIQGNSAGAGFGGGICLSKVNGTDVANNPANPLLWYGVDIYDNIIVNNMAGWTGAGIALEDAAKVNIINNTIANNDGTATVGNIFDNITNTTTAQPGAGIASFEHSLTLATSSAQVYSDPTIQNNIIWHNRTFSWGVDASVVPAVFALIPDLNNGGTAVFSDLGVIGVAASLNPTYSILTDATGTDITNFSIDPGFVLGYFNGDRSQTVIQGEQSIVTSIGTAGALDEGGNFVDVHYGPLSPSGDYHLRVSSPAINAGVDNSAITALGTDFDNEVRTDAFDIGADEVPVALLIDTDGDGVLDTSDNCTLVANPAQTDADNDNYGNACDADLDNSNMVGSADIGLFTTAFSTGDLIADFNEDGRVGSADISIFVRLFFTAPGPSGTAQ